MVQNCACVCKVYSDRVGVCVCVCVQELVSEKLSVQQQSVELERLNEELEKIGLNREKLLQQEHTLEDR